jgi:metal-responsive CopG/Arc/MetJ family transcriptional regulator
MATEADLRRQHRLQVMLDSDELKAIDAWRFKRHMPSRAAAIRDLIRRGLLTTDDPRTLAKSEIGPVTGKSTDFGVIDVADTNASRPTSKGPDTSE